MRSVYQFSANQKEWNKINSLQAVKQALLKGRKIICGANNVSEMATLHAKNAKKLPHGIMGRLHNRPFIMVSTSCPGVPEFKFQNCIGSNEPGKRFTILDRNRTRGRGRQRGCNFSLAVKLAKSSSLSTWTTYYQWNGVSDSRRGRIFSVFSFKTVSYGREWQVQWDNLVDWGETIFYIFPCLIWPI